MIHFFDNLVSFKIIYVKLISHVQQEGCPALDWIEDD